MQPSPYLGPSIGRDAPEDAEEERIVRGGSRLPLDVASVLEEHFFSLLFE